jgi:hypothetical protein
MRRDNSIYQYRIKSYNVLLFEDEPFNDIRWTQKEIKN